MTEPANWDDFVQAHGRIKGYYVGEIFIPCHGTTREIRLIEEARKLTGAPPPAWVYGPRTRDMGGGPGVRAEERTVTDPATPIDPNAGTNNMAAIRARAEEISDQIQEQRSTPLEIGYAAVFLSLHESANQIRYIADLGLNEEQLRELADRLDALAEYTIDLGEVQTAGGGHDQSR